MTHSSMQRLIAPAAYLSKTNGSPCQRLTNILKERPSFLAELAAASTGKTVQETMRQPLRKTMQEIRAAIPFLEIVQKTDAGEVCYILHAYQPESLDALILLLERERQHWLTTQYFAGCLRLLVLSKLQPEAHFPTLDDIQNKQRERKQDKRKVVQPLTFVDTLITTFLKKEKSA